MTASITDERRNPLPIERADIARRIQREYTAKNAEFRAATDPIARERLRNEIIQIAAQSIDLLMEV